MRQRDEIYKLSGVIELDGAVFGRKQAGNQAEVLIVVETKNWIDDKGRRKSNAGFAKVIVANETKKDAQAFVDAAIKKGAMVNTDGSPSLTHLEGADDDYQVTGGNKIIGYHGCINLYPTRKAGFLLPIMVLRQNIWDHIYLSIHLDSTDDMILILCFSESLGHAPMQSQRHHRYF